MKRSIAILSLTLSITLALCGCGGSGLAQVTGKVTYKGEPLKQGLISFSPENGQPATGKIVNGNIVDVTTYELGDGIAPGQYKVLINAMEDPEDMYNTKSLIPEAYGHIRDTPFKTEIKPGQNEVSFELKENFKKGS